MGLCMSAGETVRMLTGRDGKHLIKKNNNTWFIKISLSAARPGSLCLSRNVTAIKFIENVAKMQ